MKAVQNNKDDFVVFLLANGANVHIKVGHFEYVWRILGIFILSRTHMAIQLSHMRWQLTTKKCVHCCRKQRQMSVRHCY